MTHVHEWRVWGASDEYGTHWAGANCKHCPAQLHESIVNQRLNATERLSAEDAREHILTTRFIDRLEAYAAALEGE